MARGKNVYLFVPNLIGYARIIFTLLSFGVAFRSPLLMTVLYFLSFACDELDGRFARMLDQSSKFGATLDMVTDRTATAGLLVLLGAVFPSATLLWISIMMLDISSHWFQMYATLQGGHTTHKDTASKSLLIRAYYKYRIFMGFCCVSCEVLYLALFLLSHENIRNAYVVPWPALAELAGVVGGPAAAAALSGGVPALAILCVLALPGFGVKQTANVLQLCHAADMIVAHDSKSE